MFDIGWQELFIVAVLALIVVGPKDLPKAIRTITTWVRKARMMARDLQSGVNDMVREAELDGIKDQLTKPQDLKKSITDTLDPDGELAKGLVLEEGDDKPASTDAYGDSEELGEEHQFEILNQPIDEDVMPVPESKPETKA